MNHPQMEKQRRSYNEELAADLRSYAALSFNGDLCRDAADLLEMNERALKVQSDELRTAATNLAAAIKRTEDTKNAHVKRIRRLRERAHLSPDDPTLLGDRIDAMARTLRKFEEALALLLDVCTARGVHGAAYDKASILLMNAEHV